MLSIPEKKFLFSFLFVVILVVGFTKFLISMYQNVFNYNCKFSDCSFSVILLIYMFGKKFFCKPICVNFANQFGFLILTKRCCLSAVTSNLFVCRFVCHFAAPRLEVSMAKMWFLKPWLLLCQFQGAQFFSILKTFSQSSSLSSHLWCKNVLCNQWNWESKSSVYFDIFLIFSLILNAI